MSSLWTPGGEVPVDRNSGAEQQHASQQPDSQDAGTGAEPSPEEMQAQFEEAARQLVSVPAADLIAQQAAGIYELAAIHLGQQEPKLTEARLAIDALAALVDAVGDRLGQAGEELAAIVPQLRMAYVERASGGESTDEGGSADEGPGSTEGAETEH